MSKQISKVAKGIELLGNQKPQRGSNKGFKVVGSSFFTLEIPENWDIKQELLSDFTWYIYDETQKGEVGAITLVPYDFGDESLKENIHPVTVESKCYCMMMRHCGELQYF